jgi:hypothetical protein
MEFAKSDPIERSQFILEAVAPWVCFYCFQNFLVMMSLCRILRSLIGYTVFGDLRGFSLVRVVFPLSQDTSVVLRAWQREGGETVEILKGQYVE